MLPLFACNQRAVLDIVPVAYVADALVALTRRPESIGQTYSLTAIPSQLGQNLTQERCMDVLHAMLFASKDDIEREMPKLKIPVLRLKPLRRARLKSYKHFKSLAIPAITMVKKLI